MPCISHDFLGREGGLLKNKKKNTLIIGLGEIGPKAKNLNIQTHNLDFNGKLNSKPDLFSSFFFGLKTPSAAKNAIYSFVVDDVDKNPFN